MRALVMRDFGRDLLAEDARSMITVVVGLLKKLSMVDWTAGLLPVNLLLTSKEIGIVMEHQKVRLVELDRKLIS
jgi:hypothetical protein